MDYLLLPERARFFIERFSMQAHPEGAFFAPAFRSVQLIEHPNVPAAMRSLYSSIYFLMTREHFSRWHRLQTDEMWHWYEGDPVYIHQIDPLGRYIKTILGSEDAELCFQALVPAGNWFASESVGDKGYSLCGCSLSPGFDFADFELATQRALLTVFPQHAAIIERFCP